jgi:hypothetical protein
MEMKFNRNGLILLIWCLSAAASCDSSGDGIPASLTGVYSCQESSTNSGIRKYLVEIDSVADSEGQYIISNFHNLGTNEFLFSELQGDTLWIINQVLGNLRISGKGWVSPDFRTIQFYYETDDALNIYDYSAIYSR